MSTHDITELTPDPRNARVRGDRAKQVLRHSLETFGAGRSIVIDEAGTVLAGNGTLEAAIAAGITEVEIIEPPPATLVAVQRTDLSGVKATALGLADNRTGELSRWEGDTLQEVAADLAASPEAATLEAVGFDDIQRIADSGRLLAIVEQIGVVITCPDEASQRQLLQKLQSSGKRSKALVR
jgi:hypothetical protein